MIVQTCAITVNDVDGHHGDTREWASKNLVSPKDLQALLPVPEQQPWGRLQAAGASLLPLGPDPTPTNPGDRNSPFSR